jgi:hypothetical protein
MKYIYAVEYWSTVKKNEIMSFAGKWMDGDHNVKQNKLYSERHVFLTCEIKNKTNYGTEVELLEKKRKATSIRRRQTSEGNEG